MVRRAGPGGRATLLAAIGHRMALSLVPRGLADNIGRWPGPSGWPRAYRAGGRALLDTGRLRQSIAYRSSASNVVIGTAVPYGRLLNEGGTIRPKRGKYLSFPLSPPLTRGQVRAFPRGKDAIRGAYPKSFFLKKGPEGPGVYRPSRTRVATRIASAGKRGYRRVGAPSAQYGRGRSIERIAAAVKRVRVRAFNWLRWRAAWVEDCRTTARRWLGSGTLPVRAPTSGGVLDVGVRA